MDADMASPPVPPVATTSPSGRSLSGSGSKFGASSPRQKSLVKGAGGFGPPPTTGDRVPRASSSSSAKVPKLSAENSYLKLKREKEKLKREKEDRERRKEEQRAAKAQAQHALNLKRNLEAKKKEKELQEKERKLALKQAREKAKAAAEVKAAAERKRQEDNKRKIEAYNAKKAAEREALEKMAAEKKAEEARKSKQTAAEAARAAKAASLARPKKVREHKVVGIMGVKPPPDPVSPRRRPSGAGSPRPSAPAEPPEQIDE
jgi:delta 1-pyrroline-5-carboxylate dehydrogenase